MDICLYAEGWLSMIAPITIYCAHATPLYQIMISAHEKSWRNNCLSLPITRQTPKTSRHYLVSPNQYTFVLQ